MVATKSKYMVKEKKKEVQEFKKMEEKARKFLDECIRCRKQAENELYFWGSSKL